MLALSFERSLIFAFAATLVAGIWGTVGGPAWLGSYLCRLHENRRARNEFRTLTGSVVS